MHDKSKVAIEQTERGYWLSTPENKASAHWCSGVIVNRGGPPPIRKQEALAPPLNKGVLSQLS
jgi:hypothetical protein